MAPDDHSGARPAGPVVLRIKLRYDDVEAMVQRFASNVGRSGLFLPTRSIQPVGTEVKFELRLVNDTPVLVGMGRVRYAQKPDPANPRAVFGMAIELTRVSREGRSIIIRMIERRRSLGLPDVSIPLPEDIDAARRGEVETQPRSDTSAVVRDAMTQLPSTPTAEPLTGAQPASGPIGVAKSEPSRPSSPLLTSARAGSGPIALLRDEQSARVPVPALAPEKSRPRRPRVQELIERASELSAPIIAAMPAVELDMHVDVESVLARARSLAGGELDAELDRLREAAAAPIEISVEAASAELARQLGGKPVPRRERSGSARWAPPPAIELRTVTPAASEAPAEAPSSADTHAVPEPAPERVAPSGEFSSKLRAPTEAAPAAAIAAVVEAAVASTPDTAVASAPAPAAVDDNAETPVLDGDDYAEAFVPNPTQVTGVDAVLEPATERPKPFESAHEVQTEPTNRSLLIDDDADVSSFERALDDGAGGERTEIGSLDGKYPSSPEQLAAQLDQQLAEAERELERELAADAAGEDDDAPVEEVSELDVLAEADEEDADLLAARGEAELSRGAAPVQPIEDSGYDDAVTPPPVDVSYAAAESYAYAPPARESADDFAARLDLGDDDEPPPSEEFDRDAAREFDAQVTRAVEDDYAEQLRRYNESAPRFESSPPAQPSYETRSRRPSSEPSSSYTFAENYPEAGLHLGNNAPDEFDEPHNYAPVPKPEPRKLRGPDPRLLRYGRATTASTEDLEDALAALDVDFDDLSADQRRSHRTSSRSSQPRPLPGLPIERPPTGQQPVVTKPPTGQHAPLARPAPLATPPPRSPTGAQPAVKRTTKPPPIPAAARKQPTRQVPVMQPPKRAPTEDDAVLIDFDDDE